MTTARLADVVAELTRRSDSELVALLRRRPDLPVPPPGSLGALAARAASRPSVERALAGLDQYTLEVAEAACALSGLGPVGPDALVAALGAETHPDLPRTALERLTELLLIVDARPVAALHEALGPHPARLGPPLAALTDPPSVPDLQALMAGAPPAAVRVLEALAAGPPVGTIGSGAPGGGTRWLLDQGVLHRLGPTQVVLPLEAGLAVRNGRTHLTTHPAPPEPAGRQQDAAMVAAESTRAAEEVVRLVEQVVRQWAPDPPAALRSGGLGVRDLRRLATDLETTPERAATVVEIAAMAGLVAPDDDGERTVLAVTAAAADWGEDELPLRWAMLATAWAGSPRMPWLVGTRDERGTLRAALGPGLELGWVARLRRRVLATLAELPAGTAPEPSAVHAALHWHAPRTTPPEASVAAILAEADVLGVTGAGALSGAGRTLSAHLAGGDTSVAEVAQALAADLPAPVAELLVQADLTGVVPGRPTRELAELIDLVADVESRGAALTVRFSPASVRRAMDAGVEAEALLERLAAASRTPLPQALEYLVRDTARRHGRLRVGGAAGYVRTPDPATTQTLLADPRLATLGLREIAPTVLVSAAPPGELLEALRRAEAAPVLEGPAGAVAQSRGRARLARGQARRRTPVTVQEPDEAMLTGLVRRMRAAQDREGEPVAAAATDPGHVAAVLREAASAGTEVRVAVVGSNGRSEHRRVRPVSVDAGRARMQDLDREAEIVVAVHRITSATPGT